jgi:hypothetical protein
MKWLLIASSFFFKNFMSQPQGKTFDPLGELKVLVKENGKKILLAITLSFSIAVMFISGLVMTIVSLSTQYEMNATINLTPMATSGFGLMAFALLWGAIFFSTADEEKVEKTRRSVDEPVAHPIESAIAMLVTDFVEDRQQRRMERRLLSNRNMVEEEAARIELRH